MVLIHAAAGGVGTFAVQLAQVLGARVVGTVSEANFGHLQALGADPVAYGEGLAERVRALAPGGVTAVLDLPPEWPGGAAILDQYSVTSAQLKGRDHDPT